MRGRVISAGSRGLAEEQAKGFADLTRALLITIAAIYIALAIQFRSAFKPITYALALDSGKYTIQVHARQGRGKFALQIWRL